MGCVSGRSYIPVPRLPLTHSSNRADLGRGSCEEWQGLLDASIGLGFRVSPRH